MAKNPHQKGRRTPPRQPIPAGRADIAPQEDDFTQLERLPISYQDLANFVEQRGELKGFALRAETMRRIEQITGVPVICYVTKTHNIPREVPNHIENSDLLGWSDLVNSINSDAVDVFIVSNGGSPEATERIVSLLRGRFTQVRFLIPSNAYSAATLMCFAGDEIIMSEQATLGPIDPQINGIPARAILRAFESLEKRLIDEGPRALTVYVPLIEKYDLHILEICKSAEDLSRELAGTWLSQYMLKIPRDNPRIEKIVHYFSDYDQHKSHSRSINREMAATQGVNVTNVEQLAGLDSLLRSLYNQYEFWFDKTPFFKLFENAHGVNWGRQASLITVQAPIGSPGAQPAPQPGPPKQSS